MKRFLFAVTMLLIFLPLFVTADAYAQTDVFPGDSWNEAYLHVLERFEMRIRSYEAIARENEPYMDGEPLYILFYDLNGDHTPEMIFLGNNRQGEICESADLYIYTYDDGVANSALFVPNVYCSGGNGEWYSIYTAADAQLIVEYMDGLSNRCLMYATAAVPYTLTDSLRADWNGIDEYDVTCSYYRNDTVSMSRREYDTQVNAIRNRRLSLLADCDEPKTGPDSYGFDWAVVFLRQADEQPLLLPDSFTSDAILETGIAEVNATSWTIKKGDALRYAPVNMLDRNDQTTFQFSVKDTPLREAYIWLVLETPSLIDELWIKNGFWKINSGNNDQYFKNGRVRVVTLDFLYADGDSYCDAQTVSLPDDSSRLDWTRIPLSVRRNVFAVRLRIDAIYPGTKYPTDVGITEISLAGHSAP